MATFTKFSHKTDAEIIGMRYTGEALDPEFIEEVVSRLETRNEELVKMTDDFVVQVDGDVAVGQVS